jgi:hypothetical protein
MVPVRSKIRMLISLLSGLSRKKRTRLTAAAFSSGLKIRGSTFVTLIFVVPAIAVAADIRNSMVTRVIFFIVNIILPLPPCR